VAAASTMMTQQVVGLYYATDTANYITAQVYQNSGSTGSVAVVGGADIADVGRSQFWAQKVSN